jgi:hypothetical protein
MSEFSTVWTQNMPGCGHGTTTAVTKGDVIYSACRGQVYATDSLSGALLFENDLPGRGHEEVRMALSVDQTVLFVGTNGYGIALNAADLTTMWQTSLPNCGSNTVSVCVGATYAYFGSNGYAYALDGQGNVSFTNGLSSTGHHEVRVALSLDGTIFFAGSNGYLLGMNAQNITGTLWTKSLPDSGHELVSVEAGEAVVYVGSNGYVYRIDQTTGSLLQTNDLPGMGKHEVRLSYAPEVGALYVGINGYGIGLTADTITKQWDLSLPDCGHDMVSVIAGSVDNVFFGSNGYAYEVSTQGTLLQENDLSGTGHHDINVALVNNDFALVIAQNGIILGLALAGYPSFQGVPWMEQLAPIIGPKKLREVYIPGTHDSGTFGIGPNSDYSIDGEVVPSLVKKLVPSVIVKLVISLWSITQSMNFLDQLLSGVRYLDLRVQKVGSEYNFIHSLVGPKVDELFEQVNLFYSTPANANEVIILDFQHTFGFLTPQDKTDFLNLVQTKFGDLLIPSSVGNDVTLNTIWGTKGRIIAIFEDIDTSALPVFWSKNSITSPYKDPAGVQNVADLKSFLTGVLPNAGSNFFVLQGILTADQDLIVNGLIPYTTNPVGLFSLAEETNQQINSWVQNDFKGDNLNIIICDWFQTTNFIDVVVSQNDVTGTVKALRRLNMAKPEDVSSHVSVAKEQLDRLMKPPTSATRRKT